MPYEWIRDSETQRLRLWPHQSLTRLGFVWVIGLACAFLSVPLATVLGSKVLWGLLPFMATVVGGLWVALRRSWADRTVTEELTLGPDRADLVRRDKTGERRWSGNPFWVRVHLHETGGPVSNYLTLKGSGREVEIGSFLAEDERVVLRQEIDAALLSARQQTSATTHPA